MSTPHPALSRRRRGWRYASPDVLKNLAGLKPVNQDFVLNHFGLVRPPPGCDRDADPSEPSHGMLHGWRYANPDVLARLTVLKPQNQDFVLRRLGLVRPPLQVVEKGNGLRRSSVWPPRHFEDGGETAQPGSIAPQPPDLSTDPTVAAGVLQRQAELSGDPAFTDGVGPDLPAHPKDDPSFSQRAFRMAGETLEPLFMPGVPVPGEEGFAGVDVARAPDPSALPAPADPRSIPRMFLHYLGQSGEPVAAALPKLDVNSEMLGKAPRIRDLANNAPDGTYKIDSSPDKHGTAATMAVPMPGPASAYLGHSTLGLKGDFIKQNGQFRFKGTVPGLPDTYDFNPMPEGGRSRLGEWSTGIGAQFPGKEFSMPITGTQDVDLTGPVEELNPLRRSPR